MSLTRELHIGGKDVPALSGRTAEDINPYTGEVYATVAAAGPKDVTRAVDAADAAFAEWAAVTPFARRAIFLKAADLLDARAEQVAEIMAHEAGGTRPWAFFNVALAANILREAAAAVTAPRGEVLSAQEEGALGLAVREPLGVVAAFAPWNAPVILGVRAVAAPLAAGNTVVVKPSEDAPIACGLLVADVLREAGLPDGVLNVVTNAREDAAEIAEVLIADPRVRAVNFTGSTEVGRIIGTHAAKHLKPAVLELGGKNAVIVLADADVDYAVDAVTFSVFMNSGQICMSGDRVLVHESLAKEFTRKFTAKVASSRPGTPPTRTPWWARWSPPPLHSASPLWWRTRSPRAPPCWRAADGRRARCTRRPCSPAFPRTRTCTTRRPSDRSASSRRSATTTPPWPSPTTPTMA